MKRIAVLALLLLSLVSCSYRFAADMDKKPEDVALILPYSRIYYADGHEIAYDDSLSALHQGKIVAALADIDLSVKDTINVVGLPGQEYLDGEIMSLVNVVPKNLTGARVPPAIASLLKERGDRYGLILFSEGLAWNRKAYSNAVWKGAFLGVATAILTLGTIAFYSIPEDEATHIYAMLVDVYSDKVVFFNKVSKSGNPMKDERVAAALEKLFKKYPR